MNSERKSLKLFVSVALAAAVCPARHNSRTMLKSPNSATATGWRS